ncbi:hypothetical protein N182_14790 [Sinorhizobium sp. GL2]|nr:hypothetical protein N182_14790 [Sinorhizobium sp. GL2]
MSLFSALQQLNLYLNDGLYGVASRRERACSPQPVANGIHM